MNNVVVKAFVGLFQMVAVVAALVFIPGWSIRYWQAWVYLAIYFTSVVAITLYLVDRDPELLGRRINGGPSAENRPLQKVIQAVSSLLFVVMFVLSAIDHRLSWSSVPLALVLIGDLLVIIGFVIVFLVFRENSFTSATIGVHTGQTVISTGPYAVVRHPMYLGAAILLAGSPLSLGSFWGLTAVLALSAVLVSRLLDEEVLLRSDLVGYEEYRRIVRYRLVPFVW